MPAFPIVTQLMQSFRQYPPRQKPAQFNVEAITQMMYQNMKR
jgi:hypothetical protein